MKRYRTFTVIGLMAALLLSACSQDELAENSTALPEGEYPLQIGSVTLTAEVSEQPWTRVSENPTDGMSSVWADGDRIGVRIGDNEETGIYVVNVDIEGSVVGVTPEKPVYWKDKQPATITAWYPLNEELDFTHQDEGLTYLLKGTSTVNADYNTSANLAFTHQLAKVRVVLEGDKANEVQTVTVRSHLTSPNNQGDLGSLTSTENKYVPMMEATYNGQRCWEANLRPGYLEADNTFEVAKAEGDPVRVTLDDKVTIKAGQVHTITIGVEQAPTEIDLDTYEGTTLTVSGKTTIKGNGQQKNLQITVEADAEVTLEDVILTPSATGNAITCKGDATIILTGSNSLTAKTDYSNYSYHYGSGIYVESGTLTIDGKGSLNISREYAGDYWSVGAGIGAGSGANIVIESGNIRVDDVPDDSFESGAGIGSLPGESCGDITINGGTISIGKPYWYSACIGSAQSGSCGNITISGESTVITYTQGIHAPCGIGNGGFGTCGTVTITGGATVNGVKYIETHTGTL